MNESLKLSCATYYMSLSLRSTLHPHSRSDIIIMLISLTEVVQQDREKVSGLIGSKLSSVMTGFTS